MFDILRKMTKTIICISWLVMFLVSPAILFAAEEYQLLTDIPGLQAVETDSVDFSSFINAIYKMSIGIGSALAVLVIILSGIQYSLSTVASVKVDLKQRLLYVVGGLIILLSAYLFLNIINPQLTQFDDKTGNLSDATFNSEEYELSWGEITTDEMTGRTIGSAFGVPLDTKVWVPVNSAGSGRYATEEECKSHADPRDPRCKEIDNPYTVGTSPTLSGDKLVMSSSHPAYRAFLTESAVNNVTAYGGDLRGWPINPYRSPIDFASKGNGVVNIWSGVVEADRFIQDQFNLHFKKTLRIVSAYRDPAHNKCTKKCAGVCCATSNNHQLGYSIDYSTIGLTNEELRFLQDLMITLHVSRVGWGRVNNAGTHIQWDDGVNQPNVYWCYEGTPGPFKGPGSMPGFANAGCSY